MDAKEKKAIEVLANITGYYEEIIYLDLDSCGVTFREAIKAMQAYANQRMPSVEEIANTISMSCERMVSPSWEAKKIAAKAVLELFKSLQQEKPNDKDK